VAEGKIFFLCDLCVLCGVNSYKRFFFTTESTESRLIFSQGQKDQDVNFFRLSEKNSLRSLRLCSYSALMEFILSLMRMSRVAALQNEKQTFTWKMSS
jgi:hypothetical protein